MTLEAPALETHDLNQLIVTITRLSTQESFELVGKTGDGIQVQRAEPKYVDPLEVSGDGKIAVRSANNNRSGKIMVTGIQYSPIHQQLAILDIADPEDDRISVIIQDLSNGLLYESKDGYLSKFADAAYADAQGNRTHEITSTFLEMDKSIAA